MRNILIKTIDNEKGRGKDDFVPFPDDVSSIELDGNYEFTTILIEKKDGSFYSLWFTFDYSNQIQATSEFLQFVSSASSGNVGGWTENLKSYVDLLVKNGSEDNRSLYGAYRSRLKEDIESWLKTEDPTYRLKLVQALQDTKEIGVLTKWYQNNIVAGEENEKTYKKGNQPIFVDRNQLNEVLYGCADCSNESGVYIGNSFPGSGVISFYNYGVNTGTDKSAVQTATASAVQSAIDKQCDVMKAAAWTPERQTAALLCIKDLDAQMKAIEEAINKLDDEKSETESDIAETEDQINQLNQDKADVEKQIDQEPDVLAKCIDACAGDANCIANCQAASADALAKYNDQLTKIEAELNQLNANLKELNATLEGINSSIGSLQLQNENLNTRKEDVDKCVDQINSLCGSSS